MTTKFVLNVIRDALIFSATVYIGMCAGARGEENFDPYLKAFQEAAIKYSPIYLTGENPALRTKGLDIIFGVRLSDAVGVCERSRGRIQIYLDQQYWNSHNAIDRQAVVFHELAHCLLGREHVLTLVAVPEGGSRPLSLMFPSLPMPGVYEKYREEYLEELFFYASKLANGD